MGEIRTNNVAMLEETLEICRRGGYTVGGRAVKLKLSPEEMRAVQVFLPQELEDLERRTDRPQVHVLGRCGYGCENLDSFSMARKQYREYGWLFDREEPRETLVLNFANPVNPGGGVRRGARAQEEDLCRQSSLLLSLESGAAERYYNYNRALHTYMGSDAVIITPKVEIIRDGNGTLLEETAVVAVMTCAAPKVTGGMEMLTREEYEALLYGRICGMLRCAAFLGYRTLVLGAFGCGAFGNDAQVVAGLFRRALEHFTFAGMGEKDLFRRIDFAVLCRGREDYNFRAFFQQFGGGNRYRTREEVEAQRVEERRREKRAYLDRIRGCLVGGAVGDALGYPVEFLSAETIAERYGPEGIRAYELDPASGRAVISDDTQMTLFTANGILVGETRLRLRGIGGTPSVYAARAYQDWLTTQERDFPGERGEGPEGGGSSWLLDVPELYRRRAPGNTCLSALWAAREGRRGGAEDPGNRSKGCGGIMRTAPLGLWGEGAELRALDWEAAAMASVTHGHPLGYMPSAVLNHILHRIVYPGEAPRPLRALILEAEEAVCGIFEGNQYLPELCRIMEAAIRLSENGDSDGENIRRLGQGWVAEETLGIALYCALRHEHDFSGGVIAAVNHGGDSDSTGAVTGNLLGAINGYGAIEQRWKEHLELLDVLLEMSEDLCYGCCMSEYSSYRDPDWERKYIDMRWKAGDR